MEKYFPVVSKSCSLGKPPTDGDKIGRDAAARYQPYDLHHLSRKKSSGYDSIYQTNEPMLSSSALNKFLLSTLAHPSNPITHSDIRQRSDRVFSTSTGHQVSDGRRGQRICFEDRKKLKHAYQGEDSFNDAPKIFRNVRVYINGFLDNTTDIEMKRIITQYGGQTVSTTSGCTHILTSQQLSGSKTHKILTTKTRIKVHVVKPEWVIDSVKAGRRKLEQDYSVIKITTMKNVQDLLLNAEAETR